MTTPFKISDTSSLDRLLNTRDLQKIIPVSQMTLWRWTRQKIFPKPISINNRNYWRWSDVQAWIANEERKTSLEDK